MIATETRPKPQFYVYKLDITEYWREDIRSKAGKILHVYVFDATEHTFCCEMTPSYAMRYLGPTWTDSLEDEDERQALHEDIMEGSAETDDVMYVHVRSVDLAKCEARPITDEAWAKLIDHHDGDVDAAYAEALEDEMEHLRCNGWIY